MHAMHAIGPARPQLAGPAVPREWFDTRSFPAGSFTDLTALARRKADRGVTVSLILPTLNVADTLPRVLAEVAAVSAGTPGAPALVDQVIVVDGGLLTGTPRRNRQGGDGEGLAMLRQVAGQQAP